MIRVGVVGSGFGLYGLLPAFNSIKGCKVVAISGKKTERLTKYCQEIGLASTYSSWKDMLKNEKLDALAIAVVPSAQYEIAKEAMKMGLHIFAEKPLTANLSQAKELALLAKKKNIITAVDFIFPEIDEWQKAKQLLDKKVYGELKHISVTWDFLSYDIRNGIKSWKTDIKEGGGALSFYASHSLYYIEYFAGEIKKLSSSIVYGKESKNGAETQVDILISFAKGKTGTLHISCDTKGIQKHALTFYCESGTILLESSLGVTDHFTLKTYSQDKEKIFSIKKGKKLHNEDERVRIVKKIAQRFIKGCETKTQVLPSFREGLRVQNLIEVARKHSLT